MDTQSDHAMFIALIGAGNFSRAASALKRSTSAISRQLQRIEKQNNIQLLTRTTRVLKLTPAGEIYLDSCRRIQEEINNTNMLIQDLNSKPVGTLKITSTPTFARARLITAITEFSKRYPAIKFVLKLTDDYVDLVAGGFDLAVRVGKLKDSRLIARPLLENQLVLCASPGYLQSKKEPTCAVDLLDHQLLYPSHLSFVERMRLDYFPDIEFDEQQIRLVVNDVITLYEGTKLGLGIGFLPTYLIKEDLEQSRLIELLPENRRPHQPINLVYAKNSFMPRKTIIFTEFLLAYFSSSRDLPM